MNRLQLERAQVLIYVAVIVRQSLIELGAMVVNLWWIPHHLVPEESA